MMKPYFRFETLLNLRRNIEEVLQIEYSRRQGLLKDEEVQLKSAEDDFLLTADTLKKESELSLEEFEFYRIALLCNEKRLRDLKERVEHHRQKCSEAMKELSAAASDRKMLESLKEKGERERMQLELKREQLSIDEFSQNKLGRERSGL